MCRHSAALAVPAFELNVHRWVQPAKGKTSSHSAVQVQLPFPSCNSVLQLTSLQLCELFFI